MVWCKACIKEISKSYLDRHTSSKVHIRNVDSARVSKLAFNKSMQPQINPITVFETETAAYIEDQDLLTAIGFGDYTNVTYEKVFKVQRKIIPAHLIKTFEILLEKYWLYISGRTSVKYSFHISVLYRKHDSEIPDPTPYHFSTNLTVLTTPDTIEQKVRKHIERLYTRIGESELKGSGWTLDTILSINMFATRYKSALGRSYIDLPKHLRSPDILNIQNEDAMCFLWCVIAYLYPVNENASRVTNYTQHVGKFNLKDVHFPPDIKDIDRFCKQNNIKVNIFELIDDGVEHRGGTIIKDYYTVNDLQGCNILHYTNGVRRHYLLCRNISKFYHKQGDGHIAYPCLQCDYNCSSQHVLDEHKLICTTDPDESALPEEVFPKEDYYSYNNWKYKNRLPIVIYADFEAVNEILLPNEKNHVYKQHAIATGIYIHSDYPEIYTSQYKAYYGVDVIEKFTQYIIDLHFFFKDLLTTTIPLTMKEGEEEAFKTAETCYYCNKPLKKDRVKDHDHFNGNYRGAAHKKCNLSASKPTFVPMFFHNGGKYDIHLFFTKLICRCKEKHIYVNILPRDEQTYFTIQVGCIKILDTIRFLPSSLEDLGDKLTVEECHVVKHHLGSEIPFVIEPNKKGVVETKLKKGVFPYEYVRGYNWEEINLKMNSRELPTHEDFFSRIKGCSIEEKKYLRFVSDWEAYGCSNLKEYMLKYLHLDVCILADVFEAFRKLSLTHNAIDPCWVISTPGLTWQCGIKKTEVRLRYFKEATAEHLHFIEKGVRGGVSTVLGNRHVLCTNPSTQPGKYLYKNMWSLNIIKRNYMYYHDAISLYAWSMAQSLPTGEMRFEEDLTYTRTLDDICYPDQPQNDSTEKTLGFVYEVDLEYPSNIHMLTQYYPFCPEKVKPDLQQFSTLQKELYGDKYKPTEKLILQQSDKEGYIVEGRMLDWYLDHGMKLKPSAEYPTGIRKKLSYLKSRWLKQYIDFNQCEKGKAYKAKEWGTLEYFKLMVNSFYGKTLENVRDHQNLQIVQGRDEYMKALSHPLTRRVTDFGDEVYAVHKYMKRIKMDKFPYVGFVVLELSKLLMYRYVYDVLQPIFKNNNFKCHYTDTDSIVWECSLNDNERIEDKLALLKDHMDPNCSIPGKFKDDLRVRDDKSQPIMKEGVFISAKNYGYRTDRVDDKDGIKAKGIPKVVQKGITVDRVREALLDNKIEQVKFSVIRSVKHEIFVTDFSKRYGGSRDDKRYICSDGITTYPFGYTKTCGQCSELLNLSSDTYHNIETHVC